MKEGRLISIQDIEELREEGFKKVSVTAQDVIPDDYFKAENVAQLIQDGRSTSFMYKGDIDALIKKIAALGIEDTFVEEPSLEEIFLHYYQ